VEKCRETMVVGGKVIVKVVKSYVVELRLANDAPKNKEILGEEPFKSLQKQIINM
jgi:sRNA-binding carbon storage regulator CsrA